MIPSSVPGLELSRAENTAPALTSGDSKSSGAERLVPQLEMIYSNQNNYGGKPRDGGSPKGGTLLR